MNALKHLTLKHSGFLNEMTATAVVAILWMAAL
jgi:hypothetical protein